MAKTIYAGAAGPLVHTGPGKLLALLLTTNDAATTLITLYDDTKDDTGSELLTIYLSPSRSPVYITFPAGMPVLFSTGLYVAIPAGVTGSAHVWAIGF